MNFELINRRMRETLGRLVHDAPNFTDTLALQLKQQERGAVLRIDEIVDRHLAETALDIGITVEVRLYYERGQRNAWEKANDELARANDALRSMTASFFTEQSKHRATAVALEAANEKIDALKEKLVDAGVEE